MKRWKALLPLICCLFFISCSNEPVHQGAIICPMRVITGEYLAKTTDTVVTVAVKSTSTRLIKTSDIPRDDWESWFQATVVVKEVLHGSLRPGDEITVTQEGDTRHAVDDNVLESGGYLEPFSQWLLFLHVEEDPLSGESSYYIGLGGQYRLDSKGEHILSQSEATKGYFGAVGSVEEMLTLLKALNPAL